MCGSKRFRRHGMGGGRFVRRVIRGARVFMVEMDDDRGKSVVRMRDLACRVPQAAGKTNEIENSGNRGVMFRLATLGPSPPR